MKEDPTAHFAVAARAASGPIDPVAGRQEQDVRLSVVIPTYARAEQVARLVSQLAADPLPPAAYEVVVVDDGSPEDPRPALDRVKVPFRLVVERQPNQGPAVARHRGVELSRGQIILFLDDDIVPGPRLLTEHLAAHDAAPRSVICGAIRSSQKLARLSLFERFHADRLDKHNAEAAVSGRLLRGTEVCTGNVSMRREDYFAVGGFDRSLGRSEDAELGLKLEEAGVAIRFSDAAYGIHDSEHADLGVWLRRAHDYGVSDHRIARKHPEALHVSPWHYLDIVSKLPRPAYALSVVAPAVSARLARGVMRVADGLDRIGLERPALTATMLVYGMEYYRGVREQTGSAAATLRDFGAYRAKQRAVVRGGSKRSARRAAFRRFVTSVRADHAMFQRYDAKYGGTRPRSKSLPHELVERIGFQMLACVRLMRLCKDLGFPIGAKITSRLIRHLYASDIHWDTEWADGVCINHGYALGVGIGTRIGKGVILSHAVSLGAGIDMKTRTTGAPTIEEDVHIGPGAVLLGPFSIGARSKIMAGAVVMGPVPPDSVVEPPPARITPRAKRPVITGPARAPVEAE